MHPLYAAVFEVLQRGIATRFEWRGKRQFYAGQEYFLAGCLLELYELQELTGEYAAEVKRL